MRHSPALALLVAGIVLASTPLRAQASAERAPKTAAELDSFETETEVERSADRVVVDLALPLPPPGPLRAVLGVSKGGKVLFLLDRDLAVRGLDAHAFALSRPVLATDVHPLAKPQRP